MSEQERVAAQVAKLISRNDRRRLRRDPWLLTLWVLDRLSGPTDELCRSYGGPIYGDCVRLCDRPRWHWDSHRYGRFERPDGTERIPS